MMQLFGKKNNIIKNIIISFFIAYGIRAQIPFVEKYEAYGNIVDYAIATIYAVLGKYDFIFGIEWFLFFMLLMFFESGIERKEYETKGTRALSIIFAIDVCVGFTLNEYSTITALGSLASVAVFVLKSVGLYYTFYIILILIDLVKRQVIGEKEQGFLSQRTFLKGFFILFATYMPIIVLSFPGNLCYDTMGQIWQVLGMTEYSAHHPLVSTLLIGGMVKIGGMLFGSYKIGLFIYLILQNVMLSAALAATLAALNRQKVKPFVLNIILLVYIFTPIYSNMVSTAIKDIPFIASFIGYVIVLSVILRDLEALKTRWRLGILVLMSLLTASLRNNGFYEVLITGVAISIVLCTHNAVDKKLSIRFALFGCIFPILASLLINAGLKCVLNAKNGGKAEILSLPMQVTARYISQYPDDLSEEDWERIEKVFGTVSDLGDAYHPELADYVKQYFDNSSSFQDTIEYLKTVPRMFVKHPAVCIDALLIHTYGWYTPTVSTAARYEIYDIKDMEPVEPEGIFLGIRKILVFVYRFLDRITIFGLLQNVGLATWILLYLTVKKKDTGLTNLKRLILIPLWIGLLICFASPGFTNHTRYGFPILLTIPYLIGYFVERKENYERTVQ